MKGYLYMCERCIYVFERKCDPDWFILQHTEERGLGSGTRWGQSSLDVTKFSESLLERLDHLLDMTTLIFHDRNTHVATLKKDVRINVFLLLSPQIITSRVYICACLT